MIRCAAVWLVLGLQAKAPDDGLIGHWKLDEAEGEAVDSSGHGHSGKRVGGIKTSSETPKEFVNPRSWSFDGKDGRVNIGDASAFAMKGALTIAAWVRPTANSDILGMIVNKEGEYEIWRSADGSLEFALANDDPGWNHNSTNVALPLKTWKHVALTYSAAEKKVAVYVDGKEAHTQPGQGEIGDTYEELNQLWIGGRQKEGGVEYFAGQIADVRLYDRALKADEIRAVYASTLKK